MKILEICDRRKEKLIIVGALTRESAVGDNGEETVNNDGKKLLEFCLDNDLIVTNTHFQQRGIDNFINGKYTKKSFFDYITIERANGSKVRDVRVNRSYKIGWRKFLTRSQP